MRSYKQYCGVAAALDLIGQRWTLLLVRDLLPGPRRFTDLLLPGLTPNVLSDRLKHLAEHGLIEQVTLPVPAARKVWQLTAAGMRLKPVVLALGAFGEPHLGTPDDRAMSARWMMVSLERRYTGGLPPTTIGVQVDDVPYTLSVSPEQLSVYDGHPQQADVYVSGSTPTIAALFVRGDPRPMGLTVSGSNQRLDSLIRRLTPLGIPLQ